MPCGPVNDETCSGPVDGSTTSNGMCVEGCYCPKGSAVQDGICIPRSQCPCTLHQKTFKAGEQVSNDCNSWYVLIVVPLVRPLITILHVKKVRALMENGSVQKFDAERGALL